MIFLNELKKRGHFFRKNVIALFSMFFVIIIAAGILLCYLFANQESEKTITNIDKNVECISNVSDELILNIVNQIKNLSVSNNVRMFYLNSGSDEIYSDNLKLISTLKQAVSFSAVMDSIYLYSNHRKYIITENGTVNIDASEMFSFIDKYNSLQKNDLVSHFNESEGQKVLTFMYRADDGEKSDGGIILNVKISDLLDYGENMGCIMIGGSDKNIVYSNKYDIDIEKMHQLIKKGNGIHRFGKEYYAMAEKKSQYCNFYYYIAEPLPDYGKRLIWIYVIIMLILAVLCIMFYKISFKLAEINYRPIEEISEIINNPESEKSKRYLANDENTKQIADRIFETVSYNEMLSRELKTKMELYDNAQLKVLQWQINPHFMFNTLNMLYYMANEMTGSSNKLSKALLSLSRFIRYSLKTEPILVKLRDEVNIINEYIKVMQMRLDISFDVQLDINEEFLDKKVIKMALQPVLENCFSHGIKNIDYKGIIKLSARNTDEYFEIIISDNGAGIEAEVLKELNAQLSGGVEISETHIGLSNINSRMMLMYGSGYGVKVKSEKDKGTEVILRFPA